MSSRGWIKLHRKLLDNPIFQDPYLLKLWTYCLLKASHSKHKQLVGSEVVELDEGQFIWGRIEATIDLNKGSKKSDKKSESTWERYLKLLENLDILNRKTNNKYTVVTIAKWGVYQHKENDYEHEDEQQVNTKRTPHEQQVNTNKNVKNLRTNELKKDISTTGENDAIVFYQNNIGMIRPNITEEMLDYIKDFGDEMVIESIRRSLDRNKPSWGYAKSILKSWENKGIKTIEQAKAEEVEFQNKQASKGRGFQNAKQDIVPDWFDKRKTKQSKKSVTNKDVDEILNQFKNKGAASND